MLQRTNIDMTLGMRKPDASAGFAFSWEESEKQDRTSLLKEGKRGMGECGISIAG